MEATIEMFYKSLSFNLLRTDIVVFVIMFSYFNRSRLMFRSIYFYLYIFY